MFQMPGESFEGPLPPISNTEKRISSELKEHIRILADEIGIRTLASWAGNSNQDTVKNLYEAGIYLQNQFQQAGYTPTQQEFKAHGKSCYNIEAVNKGTTNAEKIVVIGAHYDSAPFTPAANDNASGVAALLVLAQVFSGKTFPHTLRFVAFTNEEPPFFQSEKMGSLVYAQACKERGDTIKAMLSLETIGYYTDAPNSQSYPFPFNLYYPSQGNFIAFVGNTESKNLVKQSIKSFRDTTQFPSEGTAVPGWFPGIDLSDHWSFWKVGYPAVMVTDTALFRYPHYHQESDTPDKLEYDQMARVVKGLGHVVADLVGYQGDVWSDFDKFPSDS